MRINQTHNSREREIIRKVHNMFVQIQIRSTSGKEYSIIINHLSKNCMQEQVNVLKSFFFLLPFRYLLISAYVFTSGYDLVYVSFFAFVQCDNQLNFLYLVLRKSTKASSRGNGLILSLLEDKDLLSAARALTQKQYVKQ